MAIQLGLPTRGQWVLAFSEEPGYNILFNIM